LAEFRVAHCSMCGKVFQVTLRNLCPECAEVHDRQYDAVDRYLFKNRNATTEEVAEATGVPIKQIRDWIRQKKISLAPYPNLTDVCDLCGGPTRKGHLCQNCSDRITQDIKRMKEQEAAELERRQREHSFKVKGSVET